MHLWCACTFKLVGTGFAALCMSMSANVGARLAFSCALCAGEAVAAAHYFFIWRVRRQYQPAYTEKWRLPFGEEADQLVTNSASSVSETERVKAAIYANELAVDGFRFSDWLCTLVLLTIELGTTREFVSETDADTPDPPISKEWCAALQAAMVSLGAVYRFYTNEVRGRSDRKNSFAGVGCGTFLLGWGSFCLSSLAFAMTIYGLLHGLKLPSEYSDPTIHAAVVQLWLFTLIWVGYPVVMLLARLRLGGWLRGPEVPENEYTEGLSLFKDVSFGFLDATSKAFLALFVAFRAYSE